jgi:putative hemolysin
VNATSEILVILALILLNGFFAAAEIAVLTARHNRLQQAAEGGSKSARAALALLRDTSRFLSTVQVGITGVSTFAAAYGGVNLVHQLAEQLTTSSFAMIARNGNAIALTMVTGSIAFFSLILGELVPKRFALAYAERLAQFVALPMYVLSVVARPAVAILGYITTAILRVLRVDSKNESLVSVEDIEHLIETGRKQGLLKTTEHEVVLEALQLRTRRVRDVMRPRVDIDAVDIDTPAQEVVGAVAMSGFSRLPVYSDDLDHIIGFVYNKDLFQQFYLGREIDLRRLLRQPLFIPENLTLDRLLLMFQQRRTQLAIVLDEFGGTHGMVTFEDVLEELVGEIHDEHRLDEAQLVVRRDESSWLVDGRLPLHDLMELLPISIELSDDTRSVSTISGLVLTLLERLPKIGDIVTVGNVHLEVVDMDGGRIDRLLVELKSTPSKHELGGD